jgi:hypothetical protein
MKPTQPIERILTPRERELMTALLHEQVKRATSGDDRKSVNELAIATELAELEASRFKLAMNEIRSQR